MFARTNCKAFQGNSGEIWTFFFLGDFKELCWTLLEMMVVIWLHGKFTFN